MSDIVSHRPAAIPALVDQDAIAIEQALIAGNLAPLTPRQRVTHYKNVCESLGLNPFTKPFDYLTLNGKLVLYPLRSCTDQLRALKNVSLEVVSRGVINGVLTVHVRAKMPNGRTDEDFGSVPFSENIAAGDRAVNLLKAITKAKRRATLSICGLGWPDEAELEFASHKAAELNDPDEVREIAPAEKPEPEWGDGPRDHVTPNEPPDEPGQETESERLSRYEQMLQEAAALGTDELLKIWETIDPDDRKWSAMVPILRRHQQHARDIDQAKKGK